jgi:predicted Zn-dependent protease
MRSVSSSAVMRLVFSAYGRQDEHESDKLGLKYMDLAGYDLDGMVGSFQVLEKESKGPDVPLILRTHPYISDRIKAVREEIQKIRSGGTTMSPRQRSSVNCFYEIQTTNYEIRCKSPWNASV